MMEKHLKKLYEPFLWMGFNCLKAAEPLWGGSLLFTIKFAKMFGFLTNKRHSATKNHLFLYPPGVKSGLRKPEKDKHQQ